jgi:hypothetical protein
MKINENVAGSPGRYRCKNQSYRSTYRASNGNTKHAIVPNGPNCRQFRTERATRIDPALMVKYAV